MPGIQSVTETKASSAGSGWDSGESSGSGAGAGAGCSGSGFASGAVSGRDSAGTSVGAVTGGGSAGAGGVTGDAGAPQPERNSAAISAESRKRRISHRLSTISPMVSHCGGGCKPESPASLLPFVLI